jgi:anti-sigma B factor antagonist
MKWPAERSQFAMDVLPGPNAVITVSGELDIVSAPVFETAVEELDFRSLESAVLDLERLDFIDARGLRAVLYLHAACVTASVPLLIGPGPPRVQRLFELTGTDRMLPFSGGRAGTCRSARK